MHCYWGDLHNHCAVSYGRGTPRNALLHAREQLDFCTITGHAFWPDLPMDLAAEDTGIITHLGGFAKLAHFWPELLETLQTFHEEGRFVTFPSYEWHSNEFGDHNAVCNGADAPLVSGRNPDAWAAALAEHSTPFMLLPHHLGYPRGHRGVNWDVFDPDRSPLVEMYSNHGSCEADDSPFEYHHRMGPRLGEQLVREGLLRGHRFGFYASTDSHDGYPGHYGHGRTGVWADALHRQTLWEALWARRTVASTGAPILARLQLGETPAGGVASPAAKSRLKLEFEGSSSIGSVHIVESDGPGWRVRSLPAPMLSSRFRPGRHKLRVELGWGKNPQTWAATLQVENGVFKAVTPAFRFNGLDKDSPVDRLEDWNEHRVEWICQTTFNPSGQMGGTHFNAGGTQSILIELEGRENTRLRLQTEGIKIETALPKLATQSVGAPIGGLGSPAAKIHRAVPEEEFLFSHQEPYLPQGTGPGWLYARVSQTDGQTAWISPVFWDEA